MNTIYILDTSVLICDPYAIKHFTNSRVVIPITVLEELDKLKKIAGEVGRHARLSIKYIDELSNEGDIVTGVPIEDGVTVSVAMHDEAIGSYKDYGDSKILGCALSFKTGNNVVLVSKDINLRVRAKVLGLIAQDYQNHNIETYELYSGCQEITSKLLGEKLHNLGSLDNVEFEKKTKLQLNQNEFILLNNSNGDGVSIGRRVGNQIKIVRPINPWGLAPRNKEQSFLIDLLMDPSLSLVSVVGRAGGGKSLVSLACCLELVLQKRLYRNLIICRPIQTIGNELGFLPGELEAKISPYYTAISDAFMYLFSSRSGKKDSWKDQLYQYINSGVIQQEPLTYMRGRSIPDALILIDEAQNLSKEEIKTVLTRAGDRSKIILTGDIEQIDNNYLDAMNNGLTYVIDKFKEHGLAGHITLTKGERSELATLASKIL